MDTLDYPEILLGFRRSAAQRSRRIVLPDAFDERTLHAARIMVDDAVVRPVLVGDAEALHALAAGTGISLEGIDIVPPGGGAREQEYADELYRLRSGKGMTPEQALATVRGPLYTAAMMVRLGDCDGCVAGSLSTTGDVIRAITLGVDVSML